MELSKGCPFFLFLVSLFSHRRQYKGGIDTRYCHRSLTIGGDENYLQVWELFVSLAVGKEDEAE